MWPKDTVFSNLSRDILNHDYQVYPRSLYSWHNVHIYNHMLQINLFWMSKTMELFWFFFISEYWFRRLLLQKFSLLKFLIQSEARILRTLCQTKWTLWQLWWLKRYNRNHMPDSLYFRKFVFLKTTKIPKIGCEIFISMCAIFACLALFSKKVNKLICNILVTWSLKTTKNQVTKMGWKAQ